ncbi:hypothetical protein IFR05_013971 [Cadophora sp. M221]|nr:hypothetical protein IFR05_013971 [Cadophora sp. M221]
MEPEMKIVLEQQVLPHVHAAVRPYRGLKIGDLGYFWLVIDLPELLQGSLYATHYIDELALDVDRTL